MLQVANPQFTPKLYVALELSEKSWVIGLSDGIKDARHPVPARDLAALVERISAFRERQKLPDAVEVLAVYEAGPDGFSVARALRQRGLTCLVIDSASVEKSRHRRQAKTDNLDVAAMLRLLYRYDQGERKALRVVHEPTPDEEDARVLGRERKKLQKTVNRLTASVASLLKTQGISLSSSEVQKLSSENLDELTTLDGRRLGARLKECLIHSGARLALASQQLREVEAKQRALLAQVTKRAAHDEKDNGAEKLTDAERQCLEKVERLMSLKGIGLQGAWVLSHEFFGWRTFDNRKQVGAAAGLTPTPYFSGSSRREQGISKVGNARIRTLVVELAWLWLRHQPESELARWYWAKWGSGGRSRRIGIVAVARKLLIDLWRFVETGVVPNGASLKA